MNHDAADKLLLDYLDGLLTGGSKEDVARHVAGCELCRTEVEKLRVVKNAARVIAAPEVPSKATDAAILAAARTAAVRRRGAKLEAEEKSRFLPLRFVFRPSYMTAFLVVILIGAAVIYMPDMMKKGTAPSDQIALAPAPTFKEDKNLPDTKIEQPAPEAETGDGPDRLKSLGYVAENESDEGGKQIAGLRHDNRPQPARELKKDGEQPKNLYQKPGATGVLDSDGLADDGTPPKLSSNMNEGNVQPPTAEAPVCVHPNTQAPANAAPPESAETPPVVAMGQPPKYESQGSAAEPSAAPPQPAPRLSERAKRAEASGPQPSPAGSVAPAAPPPPPAHTGQTQANIAPSQQPAPSATTNQVAGDSVGEESAAKKKDENPAAAALFAKAKAAEKKKDWVRAARIYGQILKKYPNYRRGEVMTGLSNAKAKTNKNTASDSASQQPPSASPQPESPPNQQTPNAQ